MRIFLIYRRVLRFIKKSKNLRGESSMSGSLLNSSVIHFLVNRRIAHHIYFVKHLPHSHTQFDERVAPHFSCARCQIAAAAIKFTHFINSRTDLTLTPDD